MTTANQLASLGNSPVFRAYAGATTTLNAGVYTKILFNTEDFDTNNNFDSSRFTPTVAGYYQISVGVAVTGSVRTGEVGVYLYKNGTNFSTLFDATASVIFNAAGSNLVYLNGTTDYVEVYTYSGLSGATTAASSGTWFSGCLIRGA